jgi:hypothetical protein
VRAFARSQRPHLSAEVLLERLKFFGTATIVAIALVASTSAEVRGQSGECASAFAASSKLFDKPFHAYSVDTAQTDARLNGGKPRTNESIWTGTAYYVMSRGKWVKSPVDIAEMRKVKDSTDMKKATCTHLRDESVNGESATVWRIHTVTEDVTMDTEEWISKSRGLILKSEVHQDVGGAFGKSHVVMRYEYGNVRAPAGVP